MDPTDAPSEQSNSIYPRDSAGFDRVIFFSDAVFAIALTLVAVEIGIPVVADRSSSPELWQALIEKVPSLAAYAFTFFWVAFYWRANHKFTNGLTGMNGRYVAAVLVYLAFIALLPFPAATLGEYYNAVALSFFLAFMAAVSALEVLLLVVADRGDLLVERLTPQSRRYAIVGSLTPVVAAVLAIPVAFVSVPGAVAFFVLVALGLGAVVGRTLRPTTT